MPRWRGGTPTLSRNKVDELMLERPQKFTGAEVGYRPAPEGSAMRCGGCWHMYRRATDGFSVCEIFRDNEVDEHGIDPAYRCSFFTVDGDVYPLAEE